MSHQPVDKRPKAEAGTKPDAAWLGSRRPEPADRSGAPRRRMIVFVEPNPILSAALISLLNDHGMTGDLDIAAQASLSLADLEAGKVAVLAFDPEPLGKELDRTITEIRQALGDVALVAYTSTESIEIARRCIQLGFRGVLPRTMDSRLLARALMVVAEGGAYVDKRFGAALLPESLGPSEVGMLDVLSMRERAVLERVARGLNHKTVALELNIGHKTVDTYKARAMRKLGISGREDLVKFALSVGWLA